MATRKAAGRQGGAKGPSARTCPLVLDGEIEADDFTPDACFSCEEFDCSFCQAEAGSGTLKSHLFASDEDDGGDGADEGWGGGFGSAADDEADAATDEEDAF